MGRNAITSAKLLLLHMTKQECEEETACYQPSLQQLPRPKKSGADVFKELSLCK